MMFYRRLVRSCLLWGAIIAVSSSVLVSADEANAITDHSLSTGSVHSPIVLTLSHNDARVSTDLSDESAMIIDDIIDVDGQEFLLTGAEDFALTSTMGIIVLCALCIYFAIGMYLFGSTQLPRRLLDDLTISLAIETDSIQITHRSRLLEFLGLPCSIIVHYRTYQPHS